MVRMIVRHTVSDYERWRAGHDAFEPKRIERGVVGHEIYCELGDRHDVTVTMDFANPDKARSFVDFVTSDTEREAMEAGGVVGSPEIWLVEQV